MDRPINPGTQRICSFCSMSYTDGEGHDYEKCLECLLRRRDTLIDGLAELQRNVNAVRRIVGHL